MAKHIKGSAIANATSYELYATNGNGISVLFNKIPGVLYYPGKSSTGTSIELKDYANSYTMDMPVQQGCTYVFPTGCVRSWTLNSSGEGVRTFNLNTEMSNTFTPENGEVVLRVSVVESNNPYVSSSVRITGDYIHLATQSASGNGTFLIANIATGFYDNTSTTSSSATPSDYDGAYTYDIPVQQGCTYYIPHAVRSWTLDSTGVGVRTFHLTNDLQGNFTPQSGEVTLRVSVSYDKVDAADISVTISGSNDSSDIDFNVTDLELASGSYSLVVKAKADGKEDSDYSNAVTYTV